MRGAVGVRHYLRDTVMIAQIDEQQSAVIALAVDPSRQADFVSNVGIAQLGACVCAVNVESHGRG